MTLGGASAFPSALSFGLGGPSSSDVPPRGVCALRGRLGGEGLGRRSTYVIADRCFFYIDSFINGPDVNIQQCYC